MSLTLWILWTVTSQAPLSVGFSRQKYWNGLPRPPPGDLPDPGIKPTSLVSPALAGRFFTTSATWEAQPLQSYQKWIINTHITRCFAAPQINCCAKTRAPLRGNVLADHTKQNALTNSPRQGPLIEKTDQWIELKNSIINGNMVILEKCILSQFGSRKSKIKVLAGPCSPCWLWGGICFLSLQASGDC